MISSKKFSNVLKYLIGLSSNDLKTIKINSYLQNGDAASVTGFLNCLLPLHGEGTMVYVILCIYKNAFVSI